MVLNLRSEEIANGTTYTDRRSDLRNWDRGMQAYARETVNIFPFGSQNMYIARVGEQI